MRIVERRPAARERSCSSRDGDRGSLDGLRRLLSRRGSGLLRGRRSGGGLTLSGRVLEGLRLGGLGNLGSSLLGDGRGLLGGLRFALEEVTDTRRQTAADLGGGGLGLLLLLRNVSH